MKLGCFSLSVVFVIQGFFLSSLVFTDIDCSDSEYEYEEGDSDLEFAGSYCAWRVIP